MDDKIYLHTIYASRFYSTKKSLEILKKILESNELLSRRLQGLNKCVNFCGIDYISLSDYEKRFNCIDKEYNSYYQFVRFFPSIMFPKDKVDAIEPEILEYKISDYCDCINFMKMLGESTTGRYTDLADEVQVKDRISLEYMTGFMLPLYEKMNFWKKNNYNRDVIKREIETYKELLLSYNKEVPFYDSITNENIDTDDGIDNAIFGLRLFNKR